MAVRLPSMPDGPLPTTPLASSRASLLAVPAIAAGLLVLIALGVLLGHDDIDVWGTFGIPVVLAIITVPLILRSERGQAENLGRLLCAALVLKFAGSFARYLMVYELYDTGDAMRYLNAGGRTVDAFWGGYIGVGDLIPTSQGTPFVEELSGLVQVVIGTTPMGNFMLFAWLSFLGMWAFVAAARQAVPTLDVRRYAMFTLFLPSMLFWPSSVGKDAWMVFTLGVFALGAARIFTHHRGGLAAFAVGAAGMALVRPHLALLALAAFGVAFVLRGRSRPNRASGLPAQKLIGMALLVVAFSFALSQASQFLPGFGEDGSIDLATTLERTSERSQTGGSEIEATTPNTPLEYPWAFITVMFRPLLFEVSSPVEGLAALEGTALVVLAIASRKRIVAAVRQAASNPYILMAGLYTLAFAFAWSAMGNLGIIARQRVQVLPFLVLFLSVQLVRERTSPTTETPAASPAP